MSDDVREIRARVVLEQPCILLRQMGEELTVAGNQRDGWQEWAATWEKRAREVAQLYRGFLLVVVDTQFDKGKSAEALLKSYRAMAQNSLDQFERQEAWRKSHD